MSQQSSNPEKPELTERQQKMINLVNSFKSSLKQQDLWTAADIASQLIHFTNRPNERQDLLKTGVIDYIIKLIDPKYYQRERLMVHCSWILFNIASEDHNTVKYLIDRGVAKKGVSLLRHPNHEVKQNAAGFLANILADTEFRDIFLKEGIVKQIEWLFQSVAPRPSMLKNMTFLVSNLLKGKPYPPFDQVAPLIKYLAYILLNVKSMKCIEVIIDALWGFSYLTDGENRQIDRVYEFDLIPTIISLTQIPLTKLQAPVIRIIGNTLSGPTRYIDAFLQNGLLEVYSGLLEHPTKSFRKEVCWGISNIMAEDSRIIQHLFDFNDGQIIKKLVVMMSAEEQDLADEIFYCFTNACMTANIQQLYELINLGLIELLISRLEKASHVKYIRLCLEALEAVLEMFDDEPGFALMSKDEVLQNIVDCNGMEVIKNLQNDDVPAISQIARRILENHFNYNDYA